MLSEIAVLDTSQSQTITSTPQSAPTPSILVSASLQKGDLQVIFIDVSLPCQQSQHFEIRNLGSTSLKDVQEYFISGVRGNTLAETLSNIVDDIGSPQSLLSACNVQVSGDVSTKLFACLLGGLVHQIAYYYLAFSSPIGESKGDSFCDNGRLEVLPPQISSQDSLLEGLTRQNWQYIGLLTYVYSSLFTGVAAVLAVQAMSFYNAFGDYFVQKKNIDDVNVNDAIPVAIRVIYCAVLLLTQTQVSELVDSRDEILSEISSRLRHAIARIENHGDTAVQEVRTNLSSTVSAIAKETAKDSDEVQREVQSINSEIDKAYSLCSKLKDVLRLV